MLYDTLLKQSDSVRWRISDIPWTEIDPTRASPALRAMVREIALSEFTTFSGARNYLDLFSDDFDFTQWVTVWQFEETRHPHVLSRWLACCGAPIDDNTAMQARATDPFSRSRVATLTAGVISEMSASASYQKMYESATEPVLRQIGSYLASDEARHASGFFTYATREIARAVRPDRERANVLRMLHLWLRRSDDVTHPFAVLQKRVESDAELAGYAGVFTAVAAGLRERICLVIGNMVGIPRLAPDEVLTRLGELTPRAASTPST